MRNTNVRSIILENQVGTVQFVAGNRPHRIPALAHTRKAETLTVGLNFISLLPLQLHASFTLFRFVIFFFINYELPKPVTP